MEESTRHWFDKLEQKTDNNHTVLTQISTKMDMVLQSIRRQDETLSQHDKRIGEIEAWKSSQEAVNETQKQINDRIAKSDNLRWLKITGVAAAVVALKAVAIWIGSNFF